MKLDKYKIYDLVYNFHIPIIFLLFIGSLVTSGITGNVLYFVIGTVTAIILSLFSIFYLYVDFSIKLWWNSLFKYKLSKKERKLYNSILIKDAMGYGEWYDKTKGDDICGHWIKDITEEEVKLIDKIHKHFFGEDWWIATPISTAQVCAVMLDDIKDKVK